MVGGKGDAVVVSAPTVAGAVVTATLVETRKGEKVKIFKKNPPPGAIRRTRGRHRQHPETALRVTGITGADGKTTKWWDGKVDLTTKERSSTRAPVAWCS